MISRKCDLKYGASGFRVRYLDATTVQLTDATIEGEPEPNALRVTCALFKEYEDLLVH